MSFDWVHPSLAQTQDPPPSCLGDVGAGALQELGLHMLTRDRTEQMSAHTRHWELHVSREQAVWKVLAWGLGLKASCSATWSCLRLHKLLCTAMSCFWSLLGAKCPTLRAEGQTLGPGPHSGAARAAPETSWPPHDRGPPPLAQALGKGHQAQLGTVPLQLYLGSKLPSVYNKARKQGKAPSLFPQHKEVTSHNHPAAQRCPPGTAHTCCPGRGGEAGGAGSLCLLGVRTHQGACCSERLARGKA